MKRARQIDTAIRGIRWGIIGAAGLAGVIVSIMTGTLGPLALGATMILATTVVAIGLFFGRGAVRRVHPLTWTLAFLAVFTAELAIRVPPLFFVLAAVVALSTLLSFTMRPFARRRASSPFGHC